jgi:hypothetical protein
VQTPHQDRFFPFRVRSAGGGAPTVVRVTTRIRGRRLAAAAFAVVALAGCSGDPRRDAADGPTSTTAMSPAVGIAGEAPAATLPGGAPDPAAPTTTAAPGSPSESTVGGTPAPAGGGGAATGATAPGGGGGGAAAPAPAGGADPAPAAGTGSGSGSPDTGTGTGASAPAGGSESPGPSIPATAEECAALNQLLGIVDHPDLRRLKSQTGC